MDNVSPDSEGSRYFGTSESPLAQANTDTGSWLPCRSSITLGSMLCQTCVQRSARTKTLYLAAVVRYLRPLQLQKGAIAGKATNSGPHSARQ